MGVRTRLASWPAVLGAIVLLVGAGGAAAPCWGDPTTDDTDAGAPAPAVPVDPIDPLAGLVARMRQSTTDNTAAGATVSAVVLDRATGRTVSNGVDSTFPIASVVKLFIADDLLLRTAAGGLSATDRQALDVMLRSSDDGAAQTFWDRGGQNAIIARVKARYGLPNTVAPGSGNWDVTQSTAADLVHYYDRLLDGSGGLPPAQTRVMVDDLAQSTPTGTDGYPQRFGIPDGLFAEQVAVKQGWFCCWNGANQLHVSTGAVGPQLRYVLALGALQTSSAAAARETVTRTVRTLFPAGRI